METKKVETYKFSEKKLKEAISKDKLATGLTRYLKQEGVGSQYVDGVVEYLFKIMQVAIKNGKFDAVTRGKLEKIFQSIV